MAASVAERRRDLLGRLFPDGPPRLWCPPLAHYTAEGELDGPRIAAHLDHLAPLARGWLAPGSTGDGWEMNPAEQREFLRLVLERARLRGAAVLIGVLRTDANEARQSIEQTFEMLESHAPERDRDESLLAAGACGFTVCPPAGAALSQAEIGEGLRKILGLGAPTALYQLPQVTGNEMTPELVAELATEFDNFILLKDTSGQDRVAVSGCDLQGVFLVRGAEGEYARWLREGGGPYHGFLLSTANCFAPQLSEMLSLMERGERESAAKVIAPVEAVVAAAFELVADLPWGNAFTNANKALDHFMAHGAGAAGLPPPRLYCGERLPQAVVARAGRLLEQHGLMPARGYMDHAAPP